MKKYIIWEILIATAILFYVSHFRGKHQIISEKEKELTLPISILEKKSFTYTRDFIGSVQAIQSVNIVPYLSGFLKEVRIKSGEEINEGKTLFLLDERIPLANLEQAKEVTAQTYANRLNAETYYQRMKKTEGKAISSIELEQAKTEFEAADAAYQKALATQNQAQTLYDYTIIQAPISGWVGNITATVGEYLSPESKTLATIINFSPIRLTFSVPMSAYTKDFSFNNATLKVILADGHILEFKDFNVVQDNQADKITDSLSFFIDVKNTEKFLIPETYIEIHFLYPEKGILVDKNWITLTPEGAQANVLTNGIIEKRMVQIGIPLDHQYWIKSGLNEGDKIITVPISLQQIGQPAIGVPQ